MNVLPLKMEKEDVELPLQQDSDRFIDKFKSYKAIYKRNIMKAFKYLKTALTWEDPDKKLLFASRPFWESCTACLQ